MIRTAIAHLTSISAYQQGRYYAPDVQKNKGESADDYERRTWRERCHSTKDGKVFIPASAFKICLMESAAYLGKKIPGRGSKTWKDAFKSGIMVSDPLVLPITKNDTLESWVFVPAQPSKPKGPRVMKCFPTVHKWEGQVTFYVVDPTITPDVFLEHLDAAGKFIGLGVYRPTAGGYHGRFDIKKLTWDGEEVPL